MLESSALASDIGAMLPPSLPLDRPLFDTLRLCLRALRPGDFEKWGAFEDAVIYSVLRDEHPPAS